jgi:hypothetical protein
MLCAESCVGVVVESRMGCWVPMVAAGDSHKHTQTTRDINCNKLQTPFTTHTTNVSAWID